MFLLTVKQQGDTVEFVGLYSAYLAPCLRRPSESSTSCRSGRIGSRGAMAGSWRQEDFDVTEALIPVAQAQVTEIGATFPGLLSRTNFASNINEWEFQ